MRITMKNDQISVAEICEITGVKPSTLRAWRNRNGLFPHLALSEGWTRYTFGDAVAVKFISRLTASRFGMDTQAVINLANRMRAKFEEAAGDGDRFFLIDELPAEDGVLDFYEIPRVSHYELTKGLSEIMAIVNLKPIWLDVFLKLHNLRESQSAERASDQATEQGSEE
jgi:DNA-binding transcriptional MerR regulator